MKSLTEEEVQHRLAQLRTGLAFGGGAPDADVEKYMRDVLCGEKTYDDFFSYLHNKYASL